MGSWTPSKLGVDTRFVSLGGRRPHGTDPLLEAADTVLTECLGDCEQADGD